MLERRIATGGIVYYVSPLLMARRVRHAFSTRLGGISPPPFNSMNLGNPNGCEIQDDYARIWENYRLLQRAIDCSQDPPCRVHQVHGNVIVPLRAGETFDTSQKADGIISSDPARVASVRVADCVPVLLASDDGRIVAAIHAGWRGVVAEVVTHAIRAMTAAPGALVAAIGPCISESAFEVGPEVAAEFRRVFPDTPGLVKAGLGDRSFIDLPGGITQQLLAAGVAIERIDRTDRCTHRDRDEFFSHRRDHGITGRMAAIICANAMTAEPECDAASNFESEK